MTVYVPHDAELATETVLEPPRDTAKSTAIRIAALAIISVGFYGAMHRTPQQAYAETYTNAKKCLAGTQYDVSHGASVHSDAHIPHILDVDPASPSAAHPSLHFTISHSGLFASTELMFSDHMTAGVLATAHCPLPNGT
jgi:hypothetical protein